MPFTPIQLVVGVVALLLVFAIAFLFGITHRKRVAENKIGSAEKEAKSLHHSHQRKDDAHSTGSAVAFQHPNEKGVCHIIESGDQHADDTGNGQFADQWSHRRLGHLLKFLGLLFVQNQHLGYW